MTKKLLVVVDMLIDFIEPGGALPCGEAGKGIVKFVSDKVREFADNQEPMIFVMDSHANDDIEFKRFPTHCVKGSEGARLIPELAEYSTGKNAYQIYKTRYSSFYNTNMDELLASLKPDEVHVVGVCTNICVLYTVEELCNRDIKTVVYREGVASFDEPAHFWALNQMENVLGAKIISKETSVNRD